jgi:hypothetical protein
VASGWAVLEQAVAEKSIEPVPALLKASMRLNWLAWLAGPKKLLVTNTRPCRQCRAAETPDQQIVARSDRDWRVECQIDLAGLGNAGKRF